MVFYVVIPQHKSFKFIYNQHCQLDGKYNRKTLQFVDSYLFIKHEQVTSNCDICKGDSFTNKKCPCQEMIIKIG
jgi:hypothetical protein